MRLLYVASKYDYGKPEQGLSYEQCNFLDTFDAMGLETLHFDATASTQTYGPEHTGKRFEEIVRSERPDLTWCCVIRDELPLDAVRNASESGDTRTFNWFTDDHWRFEDYSRAAAPAFNFVSTTALSAVPKYREIGYDTLIKTQWAANPFQYTRMDLPLEHDVTFVGQPHGSRHRVILTLREAGLDVATWGRGWPGGRIDQEGMIRVFNQSRINLNLSNASIDHGDLSGEKLRDTLARGLGTTLAAALTRPLIKQQRKRLRRTPCAPDHPLANPAHDQIKGRDFEVPGCGGFLITGRTSEIERYYEPDREIVIADTMGELIEQCRHYLANDAQRQAIADAALARTLREHTYVHRMCDIFDRVGLPHEPPEQYLTGRRPSNVTELS